MPDKENDHHAKINSFDDLLRSLPNLENLNTELKKASPDARKKIEENMVRLYNSLQKLKENSSKENKDKIKQYLEDCKIDCERHASNSALKVAIYAGLATIACAVIGAALAVALCSVIGIGVVGLIGAGIAGAGISTTVASIGAPTFFMRKNTLEKTLDAITTDDMTPKDQAYSEDSGGLKSS